jgi:signal transduction histidine kinase
MPIVVIGLLTFHFTVEKLISKRLDNQQQLLKSFYNMVVIRHMEDMEQVLVDLGNNPSLSKITQDPEIEEKITHDWDLVRILFPRRAWIYYGDYENRIVVSPYWQPSADDLYDLRQRPWYINAMKNDGVVWSKPFVEYVTSKVVLTASLAIKDEEGNITGVLAIDTFVSDFMNMLQRNIEQKDDIILLADRNHRVLASSSSDFLDWQIPVEDSSSSANISVDKDGTIYYISELPIPSLNWCLYGLLPQEILKEDTWSIRLILWLGIGFAILIALAVAFWLSNYIIKNINRLNRYMGRIMEGDFTTSICIVGNDEFSLMNYQLNQMTDKLSSSISSVNSLIRLLSHSISNSLTSMDQRLLRLMDHPALNKGCRQDLDIVEKDLHAIQLFIQNTLLSRSNNLENLGDSCESSEIREMLELLRERMKRRASRKDQQLLIFNPQKDTEVCGSSVLLMHCLENLVDNAIKYSPLGESIEILARTDGSYLEVEVADHGCGVAKLERHKLFMEGQKINSSSTGGESSHGIGLSVSRKIMLALGGDLNYEERKGYGAIVIMKIPLMCPDN